MDDITMIEPVDTELQRRAKKAVLDACEASGGILWYAQILTPENFQDYEGHIDLYSGRRALAWKEIEKFQKRLHEAGWKCEILSIEGARDPMRVYRECRGEEDPLFW